MRKRSFGTIRKLRSGRFQARRRKSGGKLVPAPETFASEEEAEDWLHLAESLDPSRRTRYGSPTMAGVQTSEDYAAAEAERAFLLNRTRVSASGKLHGWEVLRREIEAELVLADLASDAPVGFEQMSRIAVRVFTHWSPTGPVSLPGD